MSQIAPDGAISMPTYGEKKHLCKTERFYDQPAGAFCSGFLVSPDAIVTAGHCITNASDCSAAKFVFGYSVKKEGAYPSKAEPGETYGCASIISRQYTDWKGDYALIKLDRPVTGHIPLALNRADSITEGAGLVIIGHPSGMPLKVAGDATVRGVYPEFFIANLDSFGGNSGSAVFNAKTRQVEGILVRGDIDFTQKGDCYVVNTNPQNAGWGESATKISLVLPFIKPEGSLTTSAQKPEPIAVAARPVLPETDLAPEIRGITAAFEGSALK
jgi:hypothetical protein